MSQRYWSRSRWSRALGRQRSSVYRWMPGRPARDWLRAAMWTAGVIEVVVFALPLIFFGQRIQPFVWRWDPHIFKEYGVARLVIGIGILASVGRPHAPAAARLLALFYALNLAVSIYDLALGNVARVEWAVVAYSALAAVVLASLSSARPRLSQ